MGATSLGHCTRLLIDKPLVSNDNLFMKNILKLLVLAFVFTGAGTVKGQSRASVSFHSTVNETLVGGEAIKTVRLQSGVQLEYAEQGSPSGTPVIFLHGYTDSWRSFHQVLPLLPESIHVYTISQRGHGISDRPAKGYSPGDFALDVADFMRELNISSAIIVGHSLGATIAQRFALDYPYMVKGIVLVGSFSAFTTNASVAELRSIVDNLQDPVDSVFVYQFQKSTLFRPVPVGAFQIYVSESLKVPARVWKAIANEALTVDYSKATENISVPTLIIWGDKDTFCPRSDQYTLARAIKKSSLIIYEGVGHAVHWEDPERFTADLLSFVNSIGGNLKTITESDRKEALLHY